MTVLLTSGSGRHVCHFLEGVQEGSGHHDGRPADRKQAVKQRGYCSRETVLVQNMNRTNDPSAALRLQQQQHKVTDRFRCSTKILSDPALLDDPLTGTQPDTGSPFGFCLVPVHFPSPLSSAASFLTMTTCFGMHQSGSITALSRPSSKLSVTSR